MQSITNSKVYRLVITGMMIALAFVLNRMVPATTEYHITLDFVPIFIVGMLFGPLWGALAAGISDTLGAILIPFGAYNPGITLSMMVMGLIFGLLFHKKKLEGVSLIVHVVAATVLNLIRNLFLTTLALWYVYGGGRTFWVYMGLRVPASIAISVVTLLLLPIVYKLVLKIIGHQAKQ